MAPDQSLDAETSEIAVMVTRVGCNGGVTGDVVEPEVQFETDRVIVSFTVKPGEPGAANCQGNDEVPYTVKLEEPIGHRQLLDGQCLSDPGTSRTTFCQPDGVRYAP